MRQIALLTAAAIIAVCIIAGFFTLNEANQEDLALTARLQSRSQLVADSLTDAVTPAFRSYATSTVQETIDKFATEERVAGIGVYGSNGSPVALSENLPPQVSTQDVIGTSMDSDQGTGAFIGSNQGSLYVFSDPIAVNGQVIGALVVVQNSQYIDDSVWGIWKNDLLRLLLQILLFAGAIAILVRFVFYRAIRETVESVRMIRAGEGNGIESGAGIMQPLTSEIAKMSSSLREARRAASEEARMRLEKLDSPWTAERLKEFIKGYLKDRPIFMVSNLEPFIHTHGKKGIEYHVPASGLITALEPVMEACGGMWIAEGSGDADKETADDQGIIRVPPDEPKYTLKRIWLTENEKRHYYLGFCGEALWPLCLMTHTRPVFHKEDWDEYKKVNGKFAAKILKEIRDVERPLILVQDFHFTLLPQIIKKSRPDAQIAIFWHIPWPTAEAFSICPWKKEILRGMVSADLIGFHTQQHCNNFIDTVANELEARIDLEHFSITREGRTCYIKPFPIGTAFTDRPEGSAAAADRDILAEYGVDTEYVGLGIDRMDYAKGILERLRAVEFLLAMYPTYEGKFTFLQITAPADATVEKNRQFTDDVEREVSRINKRFERKGWKPIVFVNRYHSREQITPLYKAANVCLITSLNDAMNLVAKEYVAARDDELGALVLSEFTGAARGLKGAIIVNPYSAEETAEGIHRALSMPVVEQRRRMKMMRDSLRDYNVYRWSAEFIKALAGI